MNKPHDDSIRRRGGGRPRGGRGHFEQTGRREHRDRRGAHFDQDTGDDRRTAPGRKQRDGQRGERTQRAQAERRQRHAHDPRARRSGRGGRGAERGLSPQARARLRILRDEYDPWDDDPVDPDEERDTYVDVPGGIRLQKALAQAGVASRRACEELIAAGRVSVDGQIVRRFGARVDPEKSEIRVDGMRVVTSQNLRYYALNKPRGVVSTMFDPEGRPTIGDYAAQIGPIEERLFHVGRLDTDTEGLILLTNDGELANRLTHPRYKVTKTYLAKVPGPVPRDVIRQIRKGVELDDGFVKVDSFRVIDNIEPKALVEIRLHEGRKHIVRRLMKAVGHPVSDLARTQIGPVGLNNLKSGTIRALTSQEVSELYTAAGMYPGISGGRKVAVRAIRGAVQVDANERDLILEATAELIEEVMRRNQLTTDDFISVLFTATQDLNAEFPALAARKLGFTDVPLICSTEIAVPHALPRVVRLMAHIETDRPRSELHHVYLRGAQVLRLDIAQ